MARSVAGLLALLAVALTFGASLITPIGGRAISDAQTGLGTATCSPPTLAIVGHVTGGSGSSDVFDVSVTGGDTLGLGILDGTSGETVSAVADNASDSWTQEGTYTEGTYTQTVEVWGTVAAGSGSVALAITVTWTASTTYSLYAWDVSCGTFTDAQGGAVAYASAGAVTGDFTPAHASSLMVDLVGFSANEGGSPTVGNSRSWTTATLDGSPSACGGWVCVGLAYAVGSTGSTSPATITETVSPWGSNFYVMDITVEYDSAAPPSPTCSVSAPSPVDAGSVPVAHSISGGTSPYSWTLALNRSGTFATGTSASGTTDHSLAAASYTVYLNVTDSASQTCDETASVVVHAALQLSTAASPPSPQVIPVAVVLYANSTGGTADFNFSYYLNGTLVSYHNSSSAHVTFSVGTLSHAGNYRLGIKLVDDTGATLWANLTYVAENVPPPVPPIYFVGAPLVLLIVLGLVFVGIIGLIASAFVADRRRRGQSDPPAHKTRAERRRFDRIVRGVRASNAAGRSHANPYAIAQKDLNRRRGT